MPIFRGYSAPVDQTRFFSSCSRGTSPEDAQTSFPEDTWEKNGSVEHTGLDGGRRSFRLPVLLAAIPGETSSPSHGSETSCWRAELI